jgi:hypothetical protein
MSKDHRLKAREPAALSVGLNFLLAASDRELDQFQLVKLASVADLRRELQTILDRMVDELAQAGIAEWFKRNDRQALRAALENEESAMAWARRKIREGQRSAEELVPSPSLPVGAAHIAAAVRYAERNIAEGKCAKCPRPLDRNSVRYCTEHLAKDRARYTPKGGKGHHPNTLAALKRNREALLAKREREEP